MKLEIINYTQNPKLVIAKNAAICWDSIPTEKMTDHLLEVGHLRPMEYIDINFIVSDCSAGFVRQLYTKCAGISKLQESTRYVDGSNFSWTVPKRVISNGDKAEFDTDMELIKSIYTKWKDKGYKNEDCRSFLPLGSNTKSAIKINFRGLIDLAKERMCIRTQDEFRDFMDLLIVELDKLEGWEDLNQYLKPKCEWIGKCFESYSCGKY